MSTFHRVAEYRAKPLSAQSERRLPIGQSMVVIGGLAVLSWGVVVLLAVAIRAMF